MASKRSAFAHSPLDLQSLEESLNLPELQAAYPTEEAGTSRLRRLLDILLGGLALILLLPLMLVISLVIRATSPGRAIFRQIRVGHRGQTFLMFKFRTMYQGNDDTVHREYVTRLLTEEEPPYGGEQGLYKLSRDPRVTPVGAFLRRTSLDELPQLLNVLRGEMSLVGPRPVLPWEVKHYKPRHHARFLVKPGLTGLWQVSGRNSLTMDQALDLDVEYVRRRSLRLDLLILLKTVPVVLLARGVR